MDAHRPLGEERHPDGRIQQDEARGRHEPGRSRAGGRRAALPRGDDARLVLHLRRPADGLLTSSDIAMRGAAKARCSGAVKCWAKRSRSDIWRSDGGKRKKKRRAAGSVVVSERLNRGVRRRCRPEKPPGRREAPEHVRRRCGRFLMKSGRNASVEPHWTRCGYGAERDIRSASALTCPIFSGAQREGEAGSTPPREWRRGSPPESAPAR